MPTGSREDSSPKTKAAIAAFYSGKTWAPPRHFCEKLTEDEGIAVSCKAMYRILAEKAEEGKKGNARPSRPKKKRDKIVLFFNFATERSDQRPQKKILLTLSIASCKKRHRFGIRKTPWSD